MVDSPAKHLRRKAWWTRWGAVGAALVLVGGGTAVMVAFRGASAKTRALDPATATTTTVDAQAVAAIQEATARLAASVTMSPPFGSTSVEPHSSVTVRTSFGNLALVQVTGPSRALIAGAMSSDSRRWQSTGLLVPDTTYHVSVTVIRPDGLSAERNGTFTTRPATETVSASLFPYGHMIVGVGQPVVIRFDRDIDSAAAQAAVLSHFVVAESEPVPGGWHWFSPDELHFRPRSYWPAGEQVTVTSDLSGWYAGGGVWGKGRVTASFEVDHARVSVANLITHEMTVTLDGRVVATYPLSGGRPQYPTMNGTHIVLDEEPVVHMVSSTVGIPVNSPDGYDEYVYDDVHISDSGEYVHAAPWSVADQGFINVSHGCINISPPDAQAFMDFSRIGDVVTVVGSPRPPAPGDHGVMDWSTPWSQWTPGAVRAMAPSATWAPGPVAAPTATPAAPSPTETSTTSTTTVPKPTTTVPKTTTTVPKTTTTTATTTTPTATSTTSTSGTTR